MTTTFEEQAISRAGSDTTRQASAGARAGASAGSAVSKAAVCPPSDAPTVAEPAPAARAGKRPVPRANRTASIPARYEVIGELGRGGMGLVYRARDIETCEIVALKILKPEIAADETMRETLRREVCMARKVTHKNVCRIHDFTRTESSACISMEFVDGESLLSKMQRRGALLPADAVAIALQICAGLREAHAQGIVHRDLKPANIVIARDMTVKIIDFGVAQLTQDSEPNAEMLAGTPAYMAPEQLEMRPLTPRTDIYALGLVLFEMVTGTRAFVADTADDVAMAQIRKAPQRPSELTPSIPARLDAIVLKCLEKDPAKRFASVEELRLALEYLSAPATVVLPAAALQSGKKVVRTVGYAAQADLNLLGKNLKRHASRLAAFARPHLAKWTANLRGYDWRTNPRRGTHASVAAGVFVLMLLVMVVTVRRQTRAENARASREALQSASLSPAGATPGTAAEPTSLFSAHEFNFSSVAPPAPEQATGQSSRQASAPPSALANGAQPVRGAEAVAPARKFLKQPPMAQASATVSAAPFTAGEPDTKSYGSLENEPALLDTVSSASAPKNTSVSDSASPITETYLEVGTRLGRS